MEKELTGKDSEPGELIYFKVYKSQISVIEQAIETAARMLGSDKSRGYCLEMICADFFAGANLDNGNPQTLLQSAIRFFSFLPGEQRRSFLRERSRVYIVNRSIPKLSRLRLDRAAYKKLRARVLQRDGWRCQNCGAMSNLEVHHQQFLSHGGNDDEGNLVTLCFACHAGVHKRQS